MLFVGLALISAMLSITQKQMHALADDVKSTIDQDYQKALEELGDEDTTETIDIEHSEYGKDQANGRKVDKDKDDKYESNL
jgi:hypothetical protein